MAEQREPRAVDEVLLPEELIELTTRSFKLKGGGAIMVRVEFIDEEKVVEATQGQIMPGASPELGIPEAKETKRERQARVLVKLAPALLALSCVRLRSDGTEVRPAFWWDTDPGNGALPGRMISFPDKLKLVMATLRVSGFVGGPADNATFHDPERGGKPPGADAVDAGAGNGEAPVRAGDGAEAGAGTPAAAGAGV